MMKRHPWIFGGFLLLSGLFVPMAGFAEEEPVPYAPNNILGPDFISTRYTHSNAIGLPPLGRSTAWSLYEHATSSTTVIDRSVSLYQYSHDERRGQSTITVLGVEPVSLFRPRRRLSGNFQNPFPPYNYLADYPIGTNSLTETVFIIGARVVLGILSHQLRAEQVSFPWLTF